MTYDKNLGLPIDIQAALGGPDRLTRDQLKRVGIFASRDWMAPHKDRYFAELMLLLGDDLLSVHASLERNQNAIKEFDAAARASLDEVRGTIKKFDESSRKLTRWLIGLTGVLIVLTGVIAWFTIVLSLRNDSGI